MVENFCLGKIFTKLGRGSQIQFRLGQRSVCEKVSLLFLLPFQSLTFLGHEWIVFFLNQHCPLLQVFKTWIHWFQIASQVLTFLLLIFVLLIIFFCLSKQNIVKWNKETQDLMASEYLVYGKVINRINLSLAQRLIRSKTLGNRVACFSYKSTFARLHWVNKQI